MQLKIWKSIFNKKSDYEQFFNVGDFHFFNISEAVIVPENYIKEYEDIFNKHVKLNKELSLKDMCKALSSAFKSKRIYFEPLDDFNKNAKEKYIRFGIVGAATFPNKSVDIKVHLHQGATFIYNNEEFFKQFKYWFFFILKHELIHRKQMLQDNDIKVRQKVFDMSKKQEMKLYLSARHEMMARAWEIVELYRLRGFSDSEIMQTIKNDIKTSYSSNYTLESYYILFRGTDTMKQLYKYIYEYLNR